MSFNYFYDLIINCVLSLIYSFVLFCVCDKYRLVLNFNYYVMIKIFYSILVSYIIIFYSNLLFYFMSLYFVLHDIHHNHPILFAWKIASHIPSSALTSNSPINLNHLHLQFLPAWHVSSPRLPFNTKTMPLVKGDPGGIRRKQKEKGDTEK